MPQHPTSSLPTINQGDPSDLTRPPRSQQVKLFESKITPPTLEGPQLPAGMVQLDRAPGQVFNRNPFNSIVDTPKITGTTGWLFDITRPRMDQRYELDFTGPVANVALTGVNVADPRRRGQKNQSQFFNDNMKIWETGADKARNALFGGALQGINRIGEDIGGILGGSFWGEDFERTALERYFANSRGTYDQISKIYDEDAKFYQGLQAVVASIVEFAPVGGMVNKAFKYGAKGLKYLGAAAKTGAWTKRGQKAIQAAKVAGQTTRVSSQVAANGTKIGNFIRKYQNPLSQVATAVPAGIVQNRIEGTAMALQTYEEVLEKLQPAIQNGDLSYEQAAKIAAQEASAVRVNNQAMMLQDIFQHATLFRARGLTRTGYQRPGFTWNPKQYLKNAFQSRKSLWNYGTNNFVIQGIGEALEEGFQSGMQQDAVRNAQFAARDIIRRDGGDVTTIPVDNIGLATKKNVVDRYLGYMSTDDAKFEMAVGFFAGAGQRMVQSYSEKMFDNAAYRKLTKQIETIKRDLPAGTDQEKAYKQQKIAELEYKRAVTTEKGRAEAATELINRLKSDTANSIKFAMETDDLIEAAREKGWGHIVEGMEKNAFYNLFMKHAANGTVDQLERQLQAIADGTSTSAAFPEDGSHQQKATEFLTELNELEADYLALQGMEGAHTIMGLQFAAKTNQRVVDGALKARTKAKQDIIDDLRALSGSQATTIEVNEETGEVKVTDSLGRNVPISKKLQKAIESSDAYKAIFDEGGFNDQIDAIKDRVIEDRAKLADMITPAGQSKLKQERIEFEKKIEQARRKAKQRGRRQRRSGKTQGQRDASNIDNQRRKAENSQSEASVTGDTIENGATLENDPDNLQREPTPEATIEELKEAAQGTESAPETDVKSDAEIQEEADKDFDPALDKPEYGYKRGNTSNVNKVASLLREWHASVSNGIVTIDSAEFNFIDGYMALADPSRIQEGDTLEFQIVENADEYEVTDVSDLDETNQGKKKTVKEARANKKNLAEHESDVSQTEVSEDQIENDLQPIKIIHVSADGTRTEIGFVHSPLYQREARTTRSAAEIAEDKRKLREFRDRLLAGEVTQTRISSIQPVVLNYVDSSQRQTTRNTFSGVLEGPNGQYHVAVASGDGQLFVKGGASIKSVNGIGRNSVIVNQDKIKAGLAYAVVPLKKDKNGNTHYYAAPLLTRNVSENNVEVMMTAIDAWIAGEQVPGLKSNMTEREVRNLKTVLKRFIRIRNTDSLPHKPGQTYVYTKVEGGREFLVFGKVLSHPSEGNSGVYEVTIEKGAPLAAENQEFIRQVLKDQKLNIDFNSVESNEHFFSVITEGKVETNKKAFIDHVMDSTLSTIAPVRTNEGALPNGRVIFHYNPDVRYGEGIPGLSEEDAPPLRSDDAGDPELKGRRATEDTEEDDALRALAEAAGISVEQARENREDADLLAEDEDADFDNTFDEDDTLGLLPEAATNRSEETRQQFRIPNITPVQQEQITDFIASDIIKNIKVILATTKVDKSDEQAFSEAVDDRYAQEVRNLEALVARTSKRLAATRRLIASDTAAIARLETRLKKANQALEAVRNNEDKIINLSLTKLEQRSGVTKKAKRTQQVSPAEQQTRSAVDKLFSSIFGKDKTSKIEEAEAESDENSGESAPGINKSYHSDNFYFTLDPIDTASSRLRDSLSTLVQLNENGDMSKTFFGATRYADPNQVFKILSTALEGTNPIFSEQMEALMRKYLADRGFRNKASWLPALVVTATELESLEASPIGQKFLEAVFPDMDSRAEQIKSLRDQKISPQIINEFSSVMSKHALIAPIVSIQTGSNGQVYVNAFSQNRNSLVNIVGEEFDLGMRDKLYLYDSTTGDYVINEEAFDEAIAYLTSLANAGGNVNMAEFGVMMETKLGIKLSEDTIQSLFEDGIYLQTSATARRVKMTDNGMWGNFSPFTIMREHLEAIKSKGIAYSTKGPTNFGAIKRLVNLEANRSEAKRHGTTFYAGGRNIATMTSNKYFSNLLDELFTLQEDPENPEYANKIVNKAHALFNTVFESPSQLLTAIQQEEISREDLEIQYLNFNPLKQGSDRSNDFKTLNEAEHAAVKNGLMTHSTNISSRNFTTNSGHVFKQRQATIVPLTFSDKDTVMAVKTLVPIMKFDGVGNITKETVSLFVDHVVMSEINRMRAFAAANITKDSADEDVTQTDLNNQAFEEGADLFYMFPQLNNVSVDFEGETLPLREAAAVATDEQLVELMPRINDSVRSILDAMINDKVEAFNTGIESYSDIPTAYKSMISSESKIANPTEEQLKRMVAADITLNQALGTANMIQTMVGDPAQYYKAPKLDQIVDERANINAAVRATYENLDKRLAALIAPGVEPSRQSDNEEYIQLMVPDIEMDYDAEFFEGLPDDAINNFKNIESTDAQEFITWREYLDNAVSFGEITQQTADQVATLINKYNRGYVLKPQDKELLSKVMFKAQKPVGVADHYTTLNATGQTVRQRAYIKTSAVPLLPMFTKGTQLDNLRVAMETFQEDMGTNVRLTFKSGAKVGYPSASKNASLVNADGTIKTVEELTAAFKGTEETGRPYIRVKRKYWRIQQSIPTKTNDKSTRGTQPDALIGGAASQVDALKPLVQSFSDNSNKLFELRANEIREQLMEDHPDPNNSTKVVNRERLGELLRQVAFDRGFDFNVVEGLTIGEDGQFEIPAELSPASEQFQSMLMAIARKGVARKKVTGGSQVLMSESMFRFQDDIKEGRSEVLYTDKWEGSLKPMRIENGAVQPAQILVPNKFRTPSGKVIDFRKYVNDEDRIDLSKLPEGALEGMGFRIPTQGYNSMAVVEVVGFLPEYMGDIVVAPRSFVAQMGSDFDVDKLYDYFFKMEETDGTLSKVTGEDELGLQNAILEDRISILKNTDVFNMIKKPLDFGLHTGVSNYTNEADPDMAAEINAAGGMANAIAAKKEKRSKTKGGLISEYYQRKKYLEARSAADAVGVKATLNAFVGVISSTDKSIELQEGFTFGKEAQVGAIEGATTLRGARLKQEVVSGTLSAAVDNQKEQVINKYNLNNETFGVHSALELMGFEEDFTQSFLEQPIIVALVDHVQRNEFASLDATLDSLIEGLISKHLKDSGREVTELTQEEELAAMQEVDRVFEAEFGDLTMDEVVAKLYNNIGKGVNDTSPLLNAALLMKFKQARQIMSEIRPVMQIMSGDAKGVGSTLAAFIEETAASEQLVAGEQQAVDHKSLLGLLGTYRLVSHRNTTEVNKLQEQGFIRGPLTSEGYLMVKPDSAKVAASLHTFSLTNDLVLSEFSGLFQLTNKVARSSSMRSMGVENKKSIGQGIRGYLNSNPELFTENEVTTTLDQLLYPSDTSASLAQIVDIAKNDPRLANNKFIQNLETRTDAGRPHTLAFRNSASDDLVTDGEAIAFLDLVLSSSTRPIANSNLTPKQLGRKLIDYAFLTGGTKSAVDFVRFVPTSYLIDIGFFQKLKQGYNSTKTEESHGLLIQEQLLQHNPDMVMRRVRLRADGVVLNREQSDASNVVFDPSKELMEKAGIQVGDKSVFVVDPSYEYIAIKPAGKPRRVLKFDRFSGKYTMLDNLGTGTISEYKFGSVGRSNIAENTAAHYLRTTQTGPAPVQEGDPGFALDELDPARPLPEVSGATVQREATAPSRVEDLRRAFNRPEAADPNAAPSDDLNVAGSPIDMEGENAVENIPEPTVEDLSELFNAGSPTVKPITATESEQEQLPSLANITTKLKESAIYSPTDAEVIQMLQEISESSDMAHKYLAMEILDSGILNKKKFKLVFKSGNVVDSMFTKGNNQVLIKVDPSTSNWNFEQTFLHEVGHALTSLEIRAYQTKKRTPFLEAADKVTNKALVKSLDKLDTLRELFFRKLESKDPDQISNFLLLSEEVGDKEADKLAEKIATMQAEGDLKGIQKLLYGAYGATNLDEFVTMVMSNQNFRDLLDNTVDFNLTDGTIDKSFLAQIMEVLKDMFRQILGLEQRKISDYALEQAMFVAKTKVDSYVPVEKSMIVKVNNVQYEIDSAGNIYKKLEDRFEFFSELVTDKQLRQKVELRAALQKENLSKVREGNKTFYVYEGFDRIKVASISPKGIVTAITGKEADAVIAKAFKNSDSIITGENIPRKTYEGKVTSLQPNQVFVFGSNEGGSKGQRPTHGAGSARIARDKFGAIQGQSKGAQGQSYAIVTKKFYDVVKSSTPQEITSEIAGLYAYARQNPDKEFLISDYSGRNLNGYTAEEMAQMFIDAGVTPANIVHNKNFQNVIDSIPSTPGAETNRLLPLQGTVSEFLRELQPAERKLFNKLAREGQLKTICKTV